MDNRIWRIARRPEGTDFAAALELAEEDFAPLEDGQIRIRNTHLSMDAGTRMWLTDREDGYQPPLPVGGPMTGLVLGEVIESRAEGFGVGDLVHAFGQWAEVSTVDAVMAGALLLDPTVADRRAWFGPLGMNGWTALWGIEQTGAAKPGERVLVSAAAGATGILAAQIAKLLGASYVIGSAGSDEKARMLTEKYGFDAVLNYKDAPIREQLAQAVGTNTSKLKRGFKFVGPTIVYAWMQAIGMVDDHARHCFKFAGAARG